jgi:tight adherence protein B
MDLRTFAPLFIGFLAFGAVAALVVATLLWLREQRSSSRARLQRYAGSEERLEAPEESPALRDRRFSRFEALNRYLLENPAAAHIALQLAQARVPLRVGEYLMIRVLSALVAGYLMAAVGGHVLAVIPGAALGFFAPHFYVSRLRTRRIKTLEGQLVDALSLSANSLRAGWGFTQAMAQIASEMPPPISEEFNEALQEVGIGATPEEAINNMVARIGSYDVELVMMGVLIQRQIGGNLAEMMDKTVHTIRERMRLLGDIRSIVAESQLSMWLLCLLPVALLVLLTVMMPSYTVPFLEDPRGRLMLMAGGVLELIGVLIMRKISNIEV